MLDTIHHHLEIPTPIQDGLVPHDIRRPRVCQVSRRIVVGNFRRFPALRWPAVAITMCNAKDSSASATFVGDGVVARKSG